MKTTYRLFIIFSFVVLVFSIYFFYKSYGFIFFVKDRQTVQVVLKKNFFAKAQKELLVEVVNKEESVNNGLSLRSDLKNQVNQKIDGMLFIFPQKEIRQFWMKEMFFEIDICWLDDSTFISCTRKATIGADIQENTTYSLPIYSSPTKSNLVLETLPNKLSESDLQLKLFFK
jgi:uncharacterized membrane protein (UPF0127 family)